MGQELFVQPVTVLESSLLRLGTFFRQRVELIPELNLEWALVELHCVRIGWIIFDIAMHETKKIAEYVLESAVDIHCCLLISGGGGA